MSLAKYRHLDPTRRNSSWFKGFEILIVVLCPVVPSDMRRAMDEAVMVSGISYGYNDTRR